MIRKRLNIAHFILRIAMLVLPAAAFGLAGWLRFASGMLDTSSPESLEPEGYVALLMVATVVWGLAVEHYRMYRPERMTGLGKFARQAFAACLLTMSAVFAWAFFYRDASFSRVFVALALGALPLLAIAVAAGFRTFARRLGERSALRVLILGADHFAQEAARRVRAASPMPCHIVGFVSLEGQAVSATAEPVFRFEELPAVMKRGVDDIVIAIPPTQIAQLAELMPKLEPYCVGIRAVLNFGDGVVVRDRLFDFGGLLMVDLAATPAESVGYTVLKRAFDLAFAALVVACTAPLMALIALAVRFSSPGPVFFCQERVGLNGQLFRMYKFRTMRMAEAGESDRRWTTKDDPRCTPVGRLLRRTSLDELPQFFNVLKGDMSVVGPRPERPFFVSQFLREVARYNTRHYLKTGITGWAQVNGWRGDTCIRRRVEHDLFYLSNWSLWLDLRIVLLTMVRAFKNAY